MLDVRPAQNQDIAPAVAATVAAFATDPLMAYFFGPDPETIRTASTEFFTLLLTARLELGMPAYVLLDGKDIGGLVMGYDTTRPAWPPALATRWQQLETTIPGLADRLAAYDTISEAHAPPEPHHYLGVISVHPTLQGKGAGRLLIDAFSAHAAADPASHGMYLETGSPQSLQFYLRTGFTLRGEGELGAAHLWCMYKESV